jgi:predicted PurR-regulated permease PerM
MDQRSIQQAWFLLLLGAVSVAFLWLTLDFIQPVFWAAVLAVIFNPIHRRIERAVGGRKAAAAVLSTCSIVLMVFLPLTLVGVAVSREALMLYGRIQAGTIEIPSFVRDLEPLIRDLIARAGVNPNTIEENVAAAAAAAAQLIASRAVVVGQNVLSAVIQTALMLYLLFFFLRDGERVLGAVGSALPLGGGRGDELFGRFTSVTRATLKGTLLVGAVQGTLGGILFWVLGIRAPVFWGVIMTMLSILPVVGPAFVWAPAAVVLIATGSLAEGIILTVGGVLVVGTADNILRPLLVGRETRMPDYMVLLSTLGGLSVFGPAGFVAGPVVAALFLTVWDMFAREHRSVPPVAAPGGDTPSATPESDGTGSGG